MSNEITVLRDQATSRGQHRRIPNIVAHLALGLQYFLQFAQESGALKVDEFDVLWERGWAAILEAAKAHSHEQEISEPAKRYIHLLQTAIASGAAHVAGDNGSAPLLSNQRAAWGWRLHEDALYGNRHQEWRPQGKCIGFVSGEDLYLIPDAAYAVAHQVGQSGGDELSVSIRTIHKRLREQALLKDTATSGRGTLTVRRTFAGKRIEVLHLHAATLLGNNPTDLTTESAIQLGASQTNNKIIDAFTLREIHGHILRAD